MVLNFINKIKDSLTKTRIELFESLGNILPVGATITDDVLDEVEEVLYEADIGVHAVEMLVEELRERAGEINRKEINPYTVMKNTVLTIISRFDDTNTISPGNDTPFVILVIGVNGVGKTTTIGKLAMRFRGEEKKVLLAACDTFRAAAIDQLEDLG